MHYYKFNIADWNLGTSHLSLVEEAIYFRLINFYYDSEAPIPIETKPVFRRLRIGSDSDIASAILDEFFTKTEKGFIHVRCDEMLKDYRKTLKNNRVNGSKGGRPRSSKPCKETENKPSGLISETEEKPKHNPNQEPITKNQEPLLKECSAKTPKAKQQKFNALELVPSNVNFAAWSEWVEFRRQKKKPVSKQAAKKQFDLLVKYSIETQAEIINSSIQNDYQGLFEPKGNQNVIQNRHSKSSHAQRSADDTASLLAYADALEAGNGSMGANEPAIPQSLDSSRGAGGGEWQGFDEFQLVAEEDGTVIERGFCNGDGAL